jgi:hypothetical protein
LPGWENIIVGIAVNHEAQEKHEEEREGRQRLIDRSCRDLLHPLGECTNSCILPETFVFFVFFVFFVLFTLFVVRMPDLGLFL